MSARSDIERAIDQFVLSRGLGINRPDHAELAEKIVEALKERLRTRCASQALLVDLKGDDYVNPRLVVFEGVEETLFPICPKTDEPVEEPIAHYCLTLPHPQDVPEI